MPGQYAVAQVTMNRAGGDPSRVCEVVYKRKQFSWTHQSVGKRRPERVDPDAWAKARAIARVTLERRMAIDLSGGATHYHATRVRPYWAKTMSVTKTIGRHIFYFKGQS